MRAGLQRRCCPVADEAAFNVVTALTATVSTYFSYLATAAAWADRHGISAGDADRFLRGAAGALGDDSRSRRQLVTDHETPKGINERVRTTWFDTPNTNALTKTLDAILADLN